MSALPTKPELRVALKRALAAITPEERKAASARICMAIAATSAFRNSRVTMGYLALRDEPDVQALLERGLKEGREVCLPRLEIDSDRMAAVVVDAMDSRNLELGPFGIRQPRAGRPARSPGEIDLILVPGLGFSGVPEVFASRNRRGFARLGRGAGYYDKFLSETRAFTIGIATNQQVVASIPADERDVPLDAIATPDGVRFAS